MHTIKAFIGDLPWTEHPEAPGMKTKILAEILEEGLSVHVNHIPHEGVPEHAHPQRHIIFVISGQGRIWIEDAGDIGLEPGVFVLVPSNLRHYIADVRGELGLLSLSMRPRIED